MRSEVAQGGESRAEEAQRPPAARRFQLVKRLLTSPSKLAELTPKGER